MKLYNNVKRVSDLKSNDKILNDMLTILAHNRSNYSQPLSGLRQKYITTVAQDGILYDIDEKNKKTISSIQSSNSDVPIVLTFKDNTVMRIAVKNGDEGERGRQGKQGPEGDKGANAPIDKERSSKWLVIANDTVTEDNKKVLSALQGVKMMDQIKALSEIYMTEYQYSLLFTNHVTIEAEFETYEDGQLVQLIYEDPDSHQRYVKYWTFESEGDQEYFVLNHFRSTEDEKAYDSVYCDLWEDIYLGGTRGYFSATSNQLVDGSQLYVYDEKTNSYKPIDQFDESRVVYDKDGNRINLDEYDWAYGERRFEYYLSAPDCLVNVNYVPSTGYDFNLVASEIVLNIYIFDAMVDGKPTYKIIPKDQVDSKGNDTYYRRKDDGSFEEIERNEVESYIEKKPIRYYKEIDGEWVEVESLSRIDTNNWEEYIVVEYEKKTNTNKFTHYYHVETARGDNYYVQKSQILNPYSIEYFIYDEDRQYFTRRIKTFTDEEGNVLFGYEYTKIVIPFWVEADFYTDVEDQRVKILNADTKYLTDEEEQKKIFIESIEFTENNVTIAKNMNKNIDVNIFPENANQTNMILEYDENLITLYEDGRIAAVESDAVTTDTVVSVWYENNPLIRDSVNLHIVTPVSDIVFETTKLNIYPGTTQKLNWTIVPEQVTNSNISFEVSDPSMITIDKYGNVSPKVGPNGEFNMGNCQITATADDGFGASTKIDVLVANPIKQLSITSKDFAFVNKPYQIETKIVPDDATEQSLIYESSNESVATINQSGLCTPHSVGEFTISASTKDGSNITVTQDVSVSIGVDEIKFLNFDIDTLDIGLSKEIEFELIPQNAFEKGIDIIVSDKTVYDNVEDIKAEKKISFTAPELVEGYENRYKTTITALEHGLIDFAVQAIDGTGTIAVKELMVTVPMSEIKLGETTLIMYKEDSRIISTVIGPDSTSNKSVEWHSSNTRIATVDILGRVKAISAGTCIISAISTDGNGIVASCTLIVKNHVDEIILNGGDGNAIKVLKGNYGFISASVKPDDASDQVLSWKSSNEEVCTVEDNGTVYGKSIGEATITVTSIDLGESPATSSINVQVVNKIDD